MKEIAILLVLLIVSACAPDSLDVNLPAVDVDDPNAELVAGAADAALRGYLLAETGDTILAEGVSLDMESYMFSGDRMIVTVSERSSHRSDKFGVFVTGWSQSEVTMVQRNGTWVVDKIVPGLSGHGYTPIPGHRRWANNGSSGN